MIYAHVTHFAIVLFMFMFSFIFVIVYGLIDWKRICEDYFYIVCVYDYFAVADPIIKEGEGCY